MIKKYIRGIDAQSISDEFHFERLKKQYNGFVWNGDLSSVPENKATPLRIKEIFVADKLFLDCTKSEAIEQYGLIGFQNGKPFLKYDQNGKLQGVTKCYAIAKITEEKDINGNVINTYTNCIPIPDEGLSGYDLSAFTYTIIDVNYPEI